MEWGSDAATFWKRKQTQSILQLCEEMPQGVCVCVLRRGVPLGAKVPRLLLQPGMRGAGASEGRLEGAGTT